MKKQKVKSEHIESIMNLSDDQISRVKQAIKETEQLLRKELGYSEHLQNKKQIEFYRSHINKLLNMIIESAYY